MVKTLRKYAGFTAVAFGPIILVLGALFAGGLLNISISLSERQFVGDSIQPLLWTAVLASLLLVESAADYFAFTRLPGKLPRFMLLYASWLLLGGAAGWLFLQALGGASMAVVDGAASPADVRSASIEALLPLFLVGQVVVVPWVLGSLWAINRWILPINPAEQDLQDAGMTW